MYIYISLINAASKIPPSILNTMLKFSCAGWMTLMPSGRLLWASFSFRFFCVPLFSLPFISLPFVFSISFWLVCYSVFLILCCCLSPSTSTSYLYLSPSPAVPHFLSTFHNPFPTQPLQSITSHLSLSISIHISLCLFAYHFVTMHIRLIKRQPFHFYRMKFL